jgi:hypothetical protein
LAEDDEHEGQAADEKKEVEDAAERKGRGLGEVDFDAVVTQLLDVGRQGVVGPAEV